MLDIHQTIPGLLDAKLSLPSKGIIAVIGPSGAGKTLLIRSIAGLEPSTGHVRVGDHGWDDKVPVATHRRGLGVVFQRPGLLSHLSVRGNLEYALRRRTGTGRGVSEIADLVGIQGLMQRRTSRLSGGETQRVAIARALLTSPRLLLLDEPVSALDVQTKLEILGLLVRVQQETRTPVLYVSHDLDEVARIAHHLAILEAGKITGQGSLPDMLTRLDLPLAHFADAESVLSGTAESYDATRRILTVDTPAGPIYAVSDPVDIGADVRIRVRARDISLSLEKPQQTSILNILPAEVQDIDHGGTNKAVVRLRAGTAFLISHISHLSAERLGLGKGGAVYLQVKSVALLG